MDYKYFIQERLVVTLREIGTKECLAKAVQLETYGNERETLNLRSLNLQPSDMVKIAKNLKECHDNSEFSIDSISFSYNPSLGDQGIKTLLPSLPSSIREIGFVGCGIGDVGGIALLDWVKNAPNLGMICAEQNNFSEDLKSKFQNFGDGNQRIMVVV